MNVMDITALVLTHNEEANLERTLARLTWVPRVILLDSGSTDGTLSIASRYGNVRVLHRGFDSFAGQCNYGLSMVETEWVLSMDADYVLGVGFEDEVRSLVPTGAVAGYRAGFRYVVLGRGLRRCLYPARSVLYRRAAAVYEDDGHGHKVRLKGEVCEMVSRIDHDDRKPLGRWLVSQDKYAVQEAEKLAACSAAGLPLQDRLRRMIWPAPFAVMAYTLFAKGLIFDGWAGLYYGLQRGLAEALLSLRLMERLHSKER
jgi:Glycosyl transferase family 2